MGEKRLTGRRFWAGVLDMLIVEAAAAIITWMFWDFFWYSYMFFFLGGIVVYFGLMEGFMGASVGKLACKLRVVNEDGSKMSVGTGFARGAAWLLSSVSLYVGHFMACGRDQLAMHDRMTRTRVIDANDNTVPARSSGMRSQLIGITGQFAGRSFPVTQQGILMGRDAASCNVVFPENAQGISRNHCKLQYNPQTRMFVIYDLGSSYGTFLADGTQVLQTQPIAINAGDEFYLASRQYTFRVALV